MPRRAMVPADQEDRVAKVEEGELVHFPAGSDNPPAKAKAKCDLNDGRWLCVTHCKQFANQLQKDIHIHTAKHRFAWVCFAHGVEVP